MSEHAEDWRKFSARVEHHIETYTVNQYGDKGEDLATEYTPEYCMQQIKKYAARFGKNEREGQDQLDLLKIAHYAQMASEMLERRTK
jgi:pyruvate-formate lyase-activating enzyme